MIDRCPACGCASEQTREDRIRYRVELARKLIHAGRAKVEIRDILITRTGVSKRTAYRAISVAVLGDA